MDCSSSATVGVMYDGGLEYYAIQFFDDGEVLCTRNNYCDLQTITNIQSSVRKLKRWTMKIGKKRLRKKEQSYLLAQKDCPKRLYAKRQVE